MKRPKSRSENDVREGEYPKYSKEKTSSSFSANSVNKKPKSVVDCELRELNKKLMEDIRKALNHSYDKLKKEKDSKNSNNID